MTVSDIFFLAGLRKTAKGLVSDNFIEWLPVQINPFRPHTTNFELRNSVLVWLSPSFRGWLGEC